MFRDTLVFRLKFVLRIAIKQSLFRKDYLEARNRSLKLSTVSTVSTVRRQGTENFLPSVRVRYMRAYVHVYGRASTHGYGESYEELTYYALEKLIAKENGQKRGYDYVIYLGTTGENITYR
ncbi:hypothetical protein V1477_001684 [Vespula maculifrons]|uniref:Uncharacterized protein n=1 Tax=Vespula maculifrons TaxID=7453 RepID=A0ABD2CYH8_VESMC